MEEKILLFSADDVKIGETFGRRARQLVSQQRAAWTDDSRSAIRFFPDVEEVSEVETPAGEYSRSKEPETPETFTKSAGSDSLYALAEKRLHQRKMFIIHSIAVAPIALLIFVFTMTAVSSFSYWFGGGILGAWGMAYVIHAYQFYQQHKSSQLSADKYERRMRRLAYEVDKLKRMGYTE